MSDAEDPKAAKEAECKAWERQKHKDHLGAINRLTDQFDSHHKEDKSGENKKALRDKLTIGLLIGTLIFTGFGDYIFWRTMHDARQVAILDNRPWIGAPGIAKDKTRSRGGFYSFSLTFKNIGKGPAQGMYIGANVVSYSEGQAEVDNICNKGVFQSRNDPKKFLSYGIVPGDTFQEPDNPGFVDIRKTVEGFRSMSSRTLVGCVIYRNGQTGGLSRTEFIAPLTVQGREVRVDEVWTLHAT